MTSTCAASSAPTAAAEGPSSPAPTKWRLVGTMCTPGAIGGAAVEGGGWVPGTSDELGEQGTLVEVMELVEVRGASVGPKP